MKILSSFVGLRAFSKFVSMGEVLPLRFGGGGVRALVAPMVACVSSVSVYSCYRVEGPAEGALSQARWAGTAWAARVRRWQWTHSVEDDAPGPHQPCVRKGR